MNSCAFLLILIPAAVCASTRARHVPVSADAINNQSNESPLRTGSSGAAVVRAQILLDRAHFSSGEIDGSWGHNLSVAVRNYRAAHSLDPGETIDASVWKSLDSDAAPVLLDYAITDKDVAGPFEKIPEKMEEKAKLKAMDYESPLEELAERFHASPSLLTKLNPDKKFDQAGIQITVPNVLTEDNPGQAASVEVSASDHTVEALSTDGKILASFPATVGSVHDPLPVGEWKITTISRNPWFYYNSDLFWDADETHSKAKIPPGPNNPVGIVWIGLSKEHYGIHGTPEPANIGHTESHGCIRLTNWDALTLAKMVNKNTAAILKD